MSTKQSTSNKGNQKAGAQGQRRKTNEEDTAKRNEQARNDNEYLQGGQRRPQVKLGTSKGPPADPST